MADNKETLRASLNTLHEAIETRILNENTFKARIIRRFREIIDRMQASVNAANTDSGISVHDLNAFITAIRVETEKLATSEPVGSDDQINQEVDSIIASLMPENPRRGGRLKTRRTRRKK